MVAIITWTANALTNDIENIELKGPRTINKEFSESQGNKTGEPKYSLKNEAEWYNFQMKNDNPWVTVNLNGDIKVRKTWNYSELGPDKTIDFFVECKNRSKFLEFKFYPKIVTFFFFPIYLISFIFYRILNNFFKLLRWNFFFFFFNIKFL